MKAFLFIPVLLLSFAPLKTRPVRYANDLRNALTIMPNCKDNGFSFVLSQNPETCTETVSGDIAAGEELRYEKDGRVLIFHRSGRTVRITEEGQWSHGAGCGTFSGTYERIDTQ